MPTPRRYANGAARQAAYRARQAAATQPEPEPGGRRAPPGFPTRPGPPRWARLHQQALDLLRTEQSECQDYYDARTERWQESERGETLAERIAGLEEAIGALEELCA